ncbi:MAG: septum formation initiator family protein [Sphingomonadales bacterium]|nr:septum formation initiator family protein [Sphingomonadales bacterium]
MKQAKRLLRLLRSALWPAMALTIIAFFGGYALFGSNGVLAWGDYSQKYEVRAAELAAISMQRNQLAHRVALLDPRHANPDLVDELVRKELGLTQPDEVIIPLN